MDTLQADFRPHRFSTASLPERDRVAAWRDFFGPAVFRTEIEPTRDAPFYADIVARRLPGVTLVSSVTSSARFSRTPTHMADDDDRIDLFVNSTGGTARQAGREIVLRGGEAYVTDAAEAGAFASSPALRTHCLHVRVPRADLAPLTVRLDDMMLRPIPARTDALRYMLNYIRVALNDRALTNPELASTAAIHLRDLLAVVLGATREAAFIAERRGLCAARLQAIKQFIAENLVQPGLAVGMLAARHGTSPRSVQRMFEDEGTTFSEYVLSQRLDLAYRALTDSRNANRTVIEIALGAGFGDLSYFNRCFRRRYGAPPSWFRGGD